MTVIAIGGARSTIDYVNYYTTRVYDTSGNLLWSADHGATVYSVCVTDNDDIITGGVSSDGYTLRKYNSSGVLQWSSTGNEMGRTIYGIAIDSNGTIYTVGNTYSFEDNYYGLQVFDSLGNWQTSYITNDGNTVRGIVLDSDSNVYIAKQTTSNNVIKYNANGDLIWTRSYHNGNLYGITIDSNNYITVCGYGTSNGNIIRRDENGNLSWSYTHGFSGVYVYSVCCDILGNIYYGGQQSGGINARKLAATDGSVVWTASNYGGLANSVTVEKDGSYFYVSGNRYGTITHQQSDLNGLAVWTKDHYGNVYSISITASFESSYTFLSPFSSNVSLSANANLEFIERSLSENILLHLLTNKNWVKPTGLYVALFSSMDPLTEITSSGYQRVLYGPSDTTWALSNNQFLNNRSIQFRPFSATIVGYGFYAKASGGIPIFTKSFQAPIVMTTSQPGCYFAKQQLIVTLD